MTAKYKLLFPLLLLFLLAGCGKSDALSIEGRDWTLTEIVSANGESEDSPALSCAARNGSLIVSSADGSRFEGTYALSDRDSGSSIYTVTLDGVSGTAVVSLTTYADGKSEETLILSFPERALYFCASSEK